MKFILPLLLLSTPTIISFPRDKQVPAQAYEIWVNDKYQPEKLMDVIRVRNVITIADIAAGKYRMAFFFSPVVSDAGRLYAKDTD